jgi:repressor LexA
MRPPTARQLQILGLVAVAIEKNGYPPTIRDLMKVLGIGSTRGILDHFESMQRKGLISRDAFQSRATRVTLLGYRWLGLQPAKLDGKGILLAIGVRCACGAHRFNGGAPCPMCALAQKVA